MLTCGPFDRGVSSRFRERARAVRPTFGTEVGEAITRGHSGDAYIAPRTPTEEFLAEIWAEVLELDRVGVHDNFFELGGHSMLTMQVVAKIFERTQINLSLWTVFQSPTVASMATYLAGVGTGSDGEVPAEFESLAAEFLEGVTF